MTGKYLQIAIHGVVFLLLWCLSQHCPAMVYFKENVFIDIGLGPLSILRRDWRQDQRW